MAIERRRKVRTAIELVLGRVARGELQPGMALATTDELAGDLGVSRYAVLEAFNWLYTHGVVVSRGRSRARVVAAHATEVLGGLVRSGSLVVDDDKRTVRFLRSPSVEDWLQARRDAGDLLPGDIVLQSFLVGALGIPRHRVRAATARMVKAGRLTRDGDSLRIPGPRPLSATARQLRGWIADRCLGIGSRVPTELVAEELGRYPGTVRRAAHELVDDGELLPAQRGPGRGFRVAGDRALSSAALVMEWVCRGVLAGEFAPGSRLPSNKWIEVDPQALRWLCAWGVLRERGSEVWISDGLAGIDALSWASVEQAFQRRIATPWAERLAVALAWSRHRAGSDVQAPLEQGRAVSVVAAQQGAVIVQITREEAPAAYCVVVRPPGRDGVAEIGGFWVGYANGRPGPNQRGDRPART